MEDGGESHFFQGVRQAGTPASPKELWEPVSILPFREKHCVKYATGPAGTYIMKSTGEKQGISVIIPN